MKLSTREDSTTFFRFFQAHLCISGRLLSRLIALKPRMSPTSIPLIWEEMYQQKNDARDVNDEKGEKNLHARHAKIHTW